MKPVITVKEARKIMGKEADKFTDEEMLKLIDDLDFIAKLAIADFKKKRLKSSQASSVLSSAQEV